MAFESSTSGFGKREVHCLWTQRLQGETVSLSQARGWAPAALTAMLALLFAGAAMLLASGVAPSLQFLLPRPAALLLTVAAAALALASSGRHRAFSASRCGKGRSSVSTPSRVVLRTRSGDVVLPWEDVTFFFGKFVTRIRLQAVRRTLQRRPSGPANFSCFRRFLSGGTKGMRDAVRRVRPDMVEPG